MSKSSEETTSASLSSTLPTTLPSTLPSAPLPLPTQLQITASNEKILSKADIVAKEKEEKDKVEKIRMEGIIKEMEQAMTVMTCYPVAVKATALEEARKKLLTIFRDGNNTIRQMLLYAIHEYLAWSIELRIMHNTEFFKGKFPTMDPSQHRLNVYRSMFNFNSSIEGQIAMIKLLGRLETGEKGTAEIGGEGNDDPAKVLTHHFSHLATYESETNHMLRAAIIETLGTSNSIYALKTLTEYAKYTDNERTFHRILNALHNWGKKIETLKLPKIRKQELTEEIAQILAKEFSGNHYG